MHIIWMESGVLTGSGEVGNSNVILMLSHLLYTLENATITLVTKRFLPAYLVLNLSLLFAVL